MSINLPELDTIPVDRRQRLLEDAVRSVNQTYGRMGNVPHYVGVALVAVIVLLMYIAGYGALASVLAAVPAYFGSMAIGILLWRRSMAAELRRVIQRSIAEQAAGRDE